MGLFNIKLQDPEFYKHAQEDSVITIDKDTKTIRIEGYDKVFYYQQSEIEETLLEAGGVLPLYSQLGSNVFRRITMPRVKGVRKRPASSDPCSMSLSGEEKSGNIDW